MENITKPWERFIENITESDVVKIVTALGSADPITDKDGNLVFQSICHNSQSRKLCYYTRTKTFFCYKEWEAFSLFSLIMRVKTCDFQQAFKFACEITNYDPKQNRNSHSGMFDYYATDDWEILERFTPVEFPEEEEQVYNNNLLNLYSDLYYEGWIDEHISVESMKKYNIKYDIVNERIIIPHYNIDGELIGIRCRNLNPYANAKYCPIQIDGKWFCHALSNHLYGLNNNKTQISRLKKAFIAEGEKAVLQAETYFPDNNFVVACCGSNISFNQISLLVDLGVSEVQIGMDFDFHKIGENIEYLKYRIKALKLAKKLIPYFEVYNICGFDENTLDYKHSPTDFPKEKLVEMMKRKELITQEKIEKELPILIDKLDKLERGEILGREQDTTVNEYGF